MITFRALRAPSHYAILQPRSVRDVPYTRPLNDVLGSDWCNGSTEAFGAFSLGSNPRSLAKS